MFHLLCKIFGGECFSSSAVTCGTVLCIFASSHQSHLRMKWAVQSQTNDSRVSSLPRWFYTCNCFFDHSSMLISVFIVLSTNLGENSCHLTLFFLISFPLNSFWWVWLQNFRNTYSIHHGRCHCRHCQRIRRLEEVCRRRWPRQEGRGTQGSKFLFFVVWSFCHVTGLPFFLTLIAVPSPVLLSPIGIEGSLPQGEGRGRGQVNGTRCLVLFF